MGVIEILRDIVELAKKTNNLELTKKVVELEEQINTLSREKRTIEGQVAELQSTLSFSKVLSFKTPFFYAEGEPVPYCPNCWEGNRKSIHLVEATKGWYKCPHCNWSHIDQELKREMSKPRRLGRAF